MDELIDKNKGFIVSWRDKLNSDLWDYTTPQQKVVLEVLNLLANHSEREWVWEGKPFKAKRGQLITSLASLKKHCKKGVSVQNIRTALALYKTWGILTYKGTKTGTLITLLQYCDEQDIVTETNKANNKEPTKSQQLTTIKNNEEQGRMEQEDTNPPTLDLLNSKEETIPKEEIETEETKADLNNLLGIEEKEIASMEVAFKNAGGKTGGAKDYQLVDIFTKASRLIKDLFPDNGKTPQEMITLFVEYFQELESFENPVWFFNLSNEDLWEQFERDGDNQVPNIFEKVD